MPVPSPTVQDALDQLAPLLDAYIEGQIELEQVTRWLSSYEAQLGDRRDETWAEASPRIWALVNDLESFGNKADAHRGLETIARDVGLELGAGQ
jgi:hypothetical protein